MKSFSFRLCLIFLVALVNQGAYASSTLDFSCAAVGENSTMAFTYSPSVAGLVGQLTFVVEWGDGTITDSILGEKTILIEDGQTLRVNHVYSETGAVEVVAEYIVTAITSGGSQRTTVGFGRLYTVELDTCKEGSDLTSGSSPVRAMHHHLTIAMTLIAVAVVTKLGA